MDNPFYQFPLTISSFQGINYLDMIILKESNGDILNRFIRFGKMDSYQIQNVHVKKDQEPSSIHIAPEKRGFYAMPLKFQEMFLISSIEQTQKNTFPKNKVPRDDDGYVNIDTQAEYDKQVQHIKYDLIRHSFILRDPVPIWHHLVKSTPLNEVDRRNGYWILTSVSSFKKAIGKAIAQMAKSNEMHRGDVNIRKLDKDMFEVFIPTGTIN